MNTDNFRTAGKDVVDWIANYLTNIREQRVFPDVKPGYLRRLIPLEAPQNSEAWEKIFSDFEQFILPGVTHWQSPYMHAYFPALNSYPSMLGEMLTNAINALCFTWASNPAGTELETIVMDWLGKMIGLPSCFLHSNDQTSGGGVIQTTASEATLISLLAARTETIRRVREQHPELDMWAINARLTAYCSDQAHSSVEKAGWISLVKMRFVESNDMFSLKADALREAIDADKAAGFIPFYLCATLGTTGACAFDKLTQLGPICQQESIWLHIDAAYAGTAFICPEYRYLMKGIEYADSFAFNPSKWMMVHFDCTAMWVKNSGALHRTFNVDPLYLKHENTGVAIDYMHWQIPLSKRFRSLKLWMVIRSYGVKGLQSHVRKSVRLAEYFEHLVNSDKRFEIASRRHLGMVTFRLKESNHLTELLLTRLNSSGQLHMVPAALKKNYVIRFTVTSPTTTFDDILRDWNIIQKTANELVYKKELLPAVVGRGSLVLSNVPLSPKPINGSFIAIYDDQDSVAELNRSYSQRTRRMTRLKSMSFYSFDQSTLEEIRQDLKAHRNEAERAEQADDNESGNAAGKGNGNGSEESASVATAAASREGGKKVAYARPMRWARKQSLDSQKDDLSHFGRLLLVTQLSDGDKSIPEQGEDDGARQACAGDGADANSDTLETERSDSRTASCKDLHNEPDTALRCDTCGGSVALRGEKRASPTK